MDFIKLTPQVMSTFQTGAVALPDGLRATDLFATVHTRASGPGTTTHRLRLPPNILAALVQTLSEALGETAPNQIQRLLDRASIARVETTKTGQIGFVLTLEQTNTSRTHERPVRLFVTPDQLVALAELLAAAAQQHGLRTQPPEHPTVQ